MSSFVYEFFSPPPLLRRQANPVPDCLQPLIIDSILNGKLARRLEILEFIRISLRGTLAQQFSLLSLQCYLFFFLCHVICKGLVLREQYAIKAAVCRPEERGFSGRAESVLWSVLTAEVCLHCLKSVELAWYVFFFL